jgi:hypothetical protein
MKWAYRVDVGTIDGEVEAPDEEAAAVTAMEAVFVQVGDAALEGTWELRKVDDDS